MSGILNRWLQPQRAAKPERHMAAGLVVLSRTLPEFTKDALADQLDRIFPGTFLPKQDNSFVVGEPDDPGRFLIKSMAPGAEGIFLLHAVPGPYTGFSSFADEIEDETVRALAQSQPCWLSIDRISLITDETAAYRFIARAIAQLAPDDAAMLVHPSLLLAEVFTPELRNTLARGGHTLS